MLDDYVYHMTHIDNLPSILRRGILSHKATKDDGVHVHSISDPEVMGLNRTMFSKDIHEYVRFFLNPKNPMLYKRRSVQNDIIIFKIRLQKLCQLYGSDHVIVTDGNAASQCTDREKIDNVYSGFLDEDCIYNKIGNWNKYEDGKRKRSAEVMVDAPLLSAMHASSIIVRTPEAIRSVNQALAKSNLSKKVEITPELYF